MFFAGHVMCALALYVQKEKIPVLWRDKKHVSLIMRLGAVMAALSVIVYLNLLFVFSYEGAEENHEIVFFMLFFPMLFVILGLFYDLIASVTRMLYRRVVKKIPLHKKQCITIACMVCLLPLAVLFEYEVINYNMDEEYNRQVRIRAVADELCQRLSQSD